MWASRPEGCPAGPSVRTARAALPQAAPRAMASLRTVACKQTRWGQRIPREKPLKPGPGHLATLRPASKPVAPALMSNAPYGTDLPHVPRNAEVAVVPLQLPAEA